ncbi:MAG TPA: ABC transporter permease [Burkholderiales bacterium]|nr:ABC transporter permease [Burkholderiales bacterium]
MVLSPVRAALGYGATFAQAVQQRRLLRRPEVRAAALRQLYFTGVQALPYVALLAVLFGSVVVTLVLSFIGTDNEFALKEVVWGGIRELAPIATALIIVLRSSPAIASEVALMRLRHGIDSEVWRDAAQEDEVVLPRVVGVAVSALLLVVCFEYAAIAAALVAMSAVLDTPVLAQLAQFLGAAEWWQVPLSLGKGLIFGTGIAVIACYHGLHIDPQVKEIPKAVIAASVGSLAFVVLVDLMTALLVPA